LNSTPRSASAGILVELNLVMFAAMNAG
jgi:hypothetical protein